MLAASTPFYKAPDAVHAVDAAVDVAAATDADAAIEAGGCKLKAVSCREAGIGNS